MRQVIGATIGYGGLLGLPGSLLYVPVLVVLLYPILCTVLAKEGNQLRHHKSIVLFGVLGALGYAIPETLLGGPMAFVALSMALPVLSFTVCSVALLVMDSWARSVEPVVPSTRRDLLWFAFPVLVAVVLGSTYGFVTEWSIFG